MAFGLDRGSFSGPLPAAGGGALVLGLIFDNLRSALLVFSGGWTGGAGGGRIELATVPFRGGAPAGPPAGAVATPLDAASVRAGSVACDFLHEFCLLPAAGAAGGVMRYDLGANVSASLSGAPAHVLGVGLLVRSGPVVLAVSPSAVGIDAASFTVIGANFGPGPSRRPTAAVTAGFAGGGCNETVWVSETALICVVPAAGRAFPGVPLDVTVQLGAHQWREPGAVSFVDVGWSLVKPASLATGSFGAELTIVGTGFETGTVYRCMLATNASVALSASPIRWSVSELVFALPLWLGPAEPARVILLYGQPFLGGFLAFNVVAELAGPVEAVLYESWFGLTPACANLSAGGTYVTLHGLGFDPALLSGYACSFGNNGIRTAVQVAVLEVICEIPGGDEGGWLRAGGLDTVVLLRLGNSQEIYQSACCSLRVDCACGVADFLFVAGWQAVTPTVGYIGTSTVITVRGTGFLPNASYSCVFEEDAFTVAGMSTSSSSVVCNVSSIWPLPGLTALSLRASADCRQQPAMCGDAFFSPCYSSGPPLSFKWESSFSNLSISTGSALGGQIVTIFGNGFDIESNYWCVFMDSAVAEIATSFVTTRQTIQCTLPFWPSVATTVTLSVFIADDSQNLPVAEILSQNLPAAEFLFTITEQVKSVVPDDFYFPFSVLRVEGAGFSSDPYYYVCSFADPTSGVEINQSFASAQNSSILICMNLPTNSPRVQFRLYIQNSTSFLWRSNLTVAAGWVSLIPTELTAQGGILSVIGSNFTGDARNYNLTVCLTEGQFCVWNGIIASSIVSTREIIFSLPPLGGPAGLGEVFIYHNHLDVPHYLSPMNSVQTSGLVLIKEVAIAVSPNHGCLFGNVALTFEGYGFRDFTMASVYYMVFEDDIGNKSPNANCSVLNHTRIRCFMFPWPKPASGSVSLIFDCEQSRTSLCQINAYYVVGVFSYTVDPCVKDVIPLHLGAATPENISISGNGFLKKNSARYKCKFSNPQDSFQFVESTVIVINLTFAKCLYPMWPFQSGEVQFRLLVNATEIETYEPTLYLSIFQEVTSIVPSAGSGAGGSVTVFGAGFFYDPPHNYKILFGDVYTSATPITASSLSCRLPGWQQGIRNVSMLVVDGTLNTSLSRKLLFFYGPGMTSLSVSQGPVSGGNVIFIIGQAFQTVTPYQVAVGNLAIANVTLINSSCMLMVMPLWQYSSAEVVLTLLTNGTVLTNAGALYYMYLEVVFGRTPTSGSAYGFYLTVDGLGFKTRGNYTCKISSQGNPAAWMESKPAQPKRGSFTELEFTLPRWRYAGGTMNITIYEGDRQLLTDERFVSTFEINAVWTEAQLNKQSSFVGGGRITIHGAGFDPSLEYVCKFSFCNEYSNVGCDSTDSAQNTLPCNNDICLKGPTKAENYTTVMCSIPAWLYQSKLSYITLHQDDQVVQQMFTSAYRVDYFGSPYIQPSYSSFNARHSGGVILSFNGLNFGLVDLTARFRVGDSACSSTFWRSNTQIQCKAPQEIIAAFGIPVIASISPFHLGTLSLAFTYDGPILYGPETFMNFTFGIVRNAPVSTDWRIHSSVLTGMFSSSDLSVKSRIGFSSALSTEWKSSSLIQCRVSSGSGDDYSSSVTIDQAMSTRFEIFSYDIPRPSSHTTVNIPEGKSDSVMLGGSCFGRNNYSPSWKGISTVAEYTQWRSDTALNAMVSGGAMSSVSSVATVFLLLGSVSNGWSFDSPNLMATGTQSNLISPGKLILTTVGQNLRFSESLGSRVGVSTCEYTKWKSDSALICHVVPGTPQTLRSIVTFGAHPSSTTEVISYHRPSLTFAYSEVDEGLKMQGMPFLSGEVGQYIGQSVCTGPTISVLFCDWQLTVNFDTWTFCTKGNISCSCQYTSGASIESDEKCAILGRIQQTVAWNSLVKRQGFLAPINTASEPGGSLVYVHDKPSLSFYSEWTDYVVNFQFVVFSGESTQENWFGVIFGYIDDDNYKSLEINTILNLIRIRSRENGIFSNEWDCNQILPSIVFEEGQIYFVQVNVFQSSVSVFIQNVSDTFWDEPDIGHISSLSTQSPRCIIDGNDGYADNGPTRSSSGFFASGVGTVYFMNLHVFRLRAYQSNEFLQKGNFLSVIGNSFGLLSNSVKARNMISSCEASSWVSDTVIVSKPSQSLGGTIRIISSVGVVMGTVSETVSCNIPMISGSKPPNLPRIPSILELLMVGSKMEVSSAFTRMLRGEGSAAELSLWISDSALLARQSTGTSRSNNVAISSGQQIGSQTFTLSYDLFTVSSVGLYSIADPAVEVSILVAGKGLGSNDQSGSLRFGSTGVEQTQWESDTSVAVRVASGVGTGIQLKVTTGIIVSTGAQLVTYIQPTLSSGISFATRDLSGSWCSTEYGTCSCSGVVRYTALNGAAVAFVSTSSVECLNPIEFPSDHDDSIIKTCYCFNWPFIGGQTVTITGSGFGTDDFTPKAVLQSVASTVTRWVSESSLFCVLQVPVCSSIECSAAVVAGSQSLQVNVSVAQQWSSPATAYVPYSFSVSKSMSCPFFWVSSTSQQAILKAPSGLLCRENYGNIENLVWLIDPCLNEQCSVFVRSGLHTVLLWETTLTLTTFSAESGSNTLSVFSCADSSCSNPWQKLHVSANPEFTTPKSITGNPYLKVTWDSSSAVTSSSWYAYWTSNYTAKFQYFDIPATQQDAANHCDNTLLPLGSWKLASIQSTTELNAVQSLLTQAQAQRAWIGLRYSESGSESLGILNSTLFEWKDGSPFSFSDWEPDEIPSGAYSDQDCIAMELDTNESTWQPVPCIDLLDGFVCSLK